MCGLNNAHATLLKFLSVLAAHGILHHTCTTTYTCMCQIQRSKGLKRSNNLCTGIIKFLFVPPTHPPTPTKLGIIYCTMILTFSYMYTHGNLNVPFLFLLEHFAFFFCFLILIPVKSCVWMRRSLLSPSSLHWLPLSMH